MISGEARGRRLLTPKGFRIRPTADRIKESLFNILTGLRGQFTGCRALDIFAGTGNLGIEAISRGAALAVFIDSHRESAALVTKNLQQLGFADRGRVVAGEALSALRSLEKKEEPFELVFLDPPYGQGFAEKVLGYMSTSALVNESSIVVAEFSARETLPTSFGPLHEFDRRIYGDTVIAFFHLTGNECGSKF
ncbi:MAG: hypothetical protein FD174_1576 [Geobacteraceae bacterium]|nr:MAG: hypothetical protein FD174_1576 [Geobacteraceae bacterium]